MKEHLGRFWRVWATAAFPVVFAGWALGRARAVQHAYAERDMALLADFTVRHFLNPALVTGLTLGFWFAALVVLTRLFGRERRRARRILMIVACAGLLTCAYFIRMRLPVWRAMADSAAYTGQHINVFFGVVFLGFATVVQTTQSVRLFWISAVGAAGAILVLPAAFIERRLFRKDDPTEKKEWRRLAHLAPAFLAADLLLCVPLFFGTNLAAPKEYPHVFWISIDTLRADHLSLYGYERQTDPNLKALAADGVVVDQFISQAPWTLPSHATMFSGLPPAAHGVTTQAKKFNPRTSLFPEMLKARGYRNGAMVTALLLAPTFGYDAGFDRYMMNLEWRAKDVVNQGLAWLGEPDRPNFLFLHFFDPHYPYRPSVVFRAKFGRIEMEMERKQLGNFFDFMDWVKADPDKRLPTVINRYDECILSVDKEIGRFIERLKKLGLYDDSWIIVVSDHGEEFLEHRQMGHSATMYEELSRVPLIIKAPGRVCAGSRFSAKQVPQSAVADLILRVADDPQKWRGSLVCGEDGVPALVREMAVDGPVLGESRIFGPVRYMARMPEMKLHSPNEIKKGNVTIATGYELYNLLTDPGEQENIYSPTLAPALESAMDEAFARVAKSPGAGKDVKLDPATIQKLKSLGYIN